MSAFDPAPSRDAASPSAAASPVGLANSVIVGAVSFAIVSVLAYSIWAYRLVPGTAAMYSSIAAVYVVLSGLALSRLVHSPGKRKTFPLLFAGAFAAYAVLWCAFYFGLHGRFAADYLGALAGLAAMAFLLQRFFGRKGVFAGLLAVLFVSHGLGYFIGLKLHALVPGSTGMLLCGALHGLGFGAGLGYSLHRCQSETLISLS